MGTTPRFDRRTAPVENKDSVISFRGSVLLEKSLKQAASELQYKSQSELLHDISEKFLMQKDRQSIQLHTLKPAQLNRLERAQVTQECIRQLMDAAQILNRLWNEPGPECEQKRTA